MNEKEDMPSWREKLHTWFEKQLHDQKPRGTIASLDGVRAVAFLLVFLFHTSHAGIWGDGNNPFVDAAFEAGDTGVILFFLLSGFLLFLPYTQALLFQKAWPQPKIYYMRRILRIFPGYFFSLFILVMFTQPQFLEPQHWAQFVPFLTFTMGFYNSSGLINGPYWTLAVEFQYYLILPLIALGIFGLTRLVRPERRLWVVVGALCALMAWGLASAGYGMYFFNHAQQTFLVPRAVLNVVLFIAYGDRSKFLEDFGLGMLLAVAYLTVMRSSRKEVYLTRIRRLLPWFLLPAVALFIYALMPDYTWPLLPRVFYLFPWLNNFAVGLCYAYLLAVTLFGRSDGWVVRLFSWTPLRWLGLISYSLYIWHRPIIQLIAAHFGPALQHLYPIFTVTLFLVPTFILTVGFCFCVFVFVEKPGIRLSEKIRQRMLQKEVQRQVLIEHITPLKEDRMPQQVGAGAHNRHH